MRESDDLTRKAESRRWRRICVAIALLVLFRGVFVLCVLPPFEGWDEYQHIAYIVYLRENRELPRFGKSLVPQSIKGLLKRYPHPSNDSAQTAPRGWGTRTYATFWTPVQEEPTEVEPVPLYEAQQPPLFYLLALPFWSTFSRISDVAAIYAVRLLNVLFLAGGVFIFLRALEKCVAGLRHKLIIGLLIGSYPLYLITGARISNCALAILLGSLTFYFTVTAIKEKPVRSITLASCFLALGILAKATMLTMIPVVIAGALICAYRHRLSARDSLRVLITCGLVLLLFLGPFYYYNYKATGGFYIMSQHKDLALRGRGTWWVWSHALDIDWTTRLREWLLERDLWLSGWSFISLPNWILLPYHYFMHVFWLLVVGAGLKRGWGKRVPARKLTYLFADAAHLLVFACVVIFMVAGLAYFVTLSLADFGIPMIIPSYFMIALPAWTVFLYQAALFLGARFAFWFAHILLGFYIVSELVGTLYLMPTTFTATTGSMESWARLVQVHPVFPSPWFIVPTLAIIAGLLIYLLKILWSESTIAAHAEVSAG